LLLLLQLLQVLLPLAAACYPGGIEHFRLQLPPLKAGSATPVHREYTQQQEQYNACHLYIAVFCIPSIEEDSCPVAATAVYAGPADGFNNNDN
jgi:hypothetical protein